MKIPTLETQRLRLIPPDETSFPLYEQFYTDAEASELYGGPISADQAWARLKADLGSWHLLGFGVWVIQLLSDNRRIGTCDFGKVTIGQEN
ncbi:MAG: GNAT family N-acetyltransferase [Pseudomonadales bacterium]|nr:GNAT family N-acetyltransferase [Pseudomonadales bacterium]